METVLLILMRMKFIGIMLSLLLVVSCSTGKKAIDGAHNSQNSVDWNGSYAGVIKNSSGTEENVSLVLNPDNTYTYSNQGAEPKEVSGKFTWDESSAIIQFDAVSLPFLRLKVGENKLWPCTKKGKITGDLILNKIQFFSDITIGKWFLRELNGKQVKLGSEVMPTLELDGEGQVSAFGGCNRFNGSYVVYSDQSLTFNALAGTKKYCAETMELETAYIDALSKSTRYEIADNVLRLYDETQLLCSFKR